MGSALLEAAVEYAENGFPVFPLGAGKKIPATSNGVKDATTDIKKIKEWWGRWPNANIGIPMGKISGLIGLDIDYKDGCDPEFLKKIPNTVIATSPNGGHHAYFKYTNGPIKNNLKIEKGVTIRSDGYYFVVAPSVLDDGKAYGFIARGLGDGEILEIPEWFSSVVETENKKPLEIPEKIKKGEQHMTLFRLGCSLRGKGASFDEVLAAFIAMSGRLEEPPPIKNLEELANDICKRYEAGSYVSISDVDNILRDYVNSDVNKIEVEDFKEEKFINCLGHDEEMYFYTTDSNKQIIQLARSSHGSTNFLDLQPLEYWVERYGENTKKGLKIHWDKAASDMMKSCRVNGIFNPEKVRGIGCWSEGKKFVVHLGDRLIVDKKTIPLGSRNSEFIYELGKKMPDISSEWLTTGECGLLIDAVMSLKWKISDDAVYFLGWLAICRIAGALNWRPHIWLTGPSGSGKSTILEMIVKTIVGEWGIPVIGASTEAGIRQAIGKDSRPVVFDEAETTNEKSSRKIQNILELVRQASSNTDAKIMKGTANQSGMAFKVNCLFLLSSIRVNLVEEADKNRFTVCELIRNTPSEWPNIQSKISKIGEDFGEKLFSRSVACFGSIIKNRNKIAKEIAKTHNQRVGQQYGTLLAGYLSLITDSVVSDEEISGLVSGLHLSNGNVLEIEEDENECLNWILNHKIIITDTDGDKTEGTIASLIDRVRQELVISSCHYQSILETFGLKLVSEKIMHDKYGQFLFIAKTHAEVGRIFNGTKWHGGMWGRALMRLYNAESCKTRFGKGNQIWCVKIPVMDLVNAPDN